MVTSVAIALTGSAVMDIATRENTNNNDIRTENIGFFNNVLVFMLSI